MNDFNKPEADDSNFHGTGERILVVDDEPDILSWLDTFLTIYGYTVFCAPAAANALELFEKEHGHFDLLFTDVTLPKTSGVELAEEILSLRSNMAILLGSGYIDDEAAWTAVQEKGYPVLNKPYDPYELLKTIKQLTSA